jgi:transposase-like protein
LCDVRGKALTTDQMEISRLKAELSQMRMERDILKNCPRLSPPVRGRNGLWYEADRRVAADSLLVV